MGWTCLSITKLQRLHRWSLGIDKQFHSTLCNGCNFVSMLGLQLNHVSERGPGSMLYSSQVPPSHDDVIKWKQFPRYWPFVRGIHRSPVISPHKGQCRGALMYFFCAWINGWVNNRGGGDLRRHRTHYGVIVMYCAVLYHVYWVRERETMHIPTESFLM